MTRTRVVLAAAAVFACAAAPAHAQWTAAAAVEHFTWKEKTQPIRVEEKGPRFSGTVGYALPVKSGPLGAAYATWYGGQVDYTGSFQFDPTRAATGSTTYHGATLGGEFRWRFPRFVDALAGLEYERWRRQLSISQEEKYRVTSLRIGVDHPATDAQPFRAAAGVRWMLSTHEDATIEENGVTYALEFEPGAGSNFYGSAGWRFLPHVTALAYYDAMRFGRSNLVELRKRRRPIATVFQPETDVDVLGVKIEYGW